MGPGDGDRATWEFGKTIINILLISVIWNGMGVPLIFTLPPLAGKRPIILAKAEPIGLNGLQHLERRWQTLDSSAMWHWGCSLTVSLDNPPEFPLSPLTQTSVRHPLAQLLDVGKFSASTIPRALLAGT
ncbi:MAG: hypothetical protein ACREDV_08865 [Methylocella sp.]